MILFGVILSFDERLSFETESVRSVIQMKTDSGISWIAGLGYSYSMVAGGLWVTS